MPFAPAALARTSVLLSQPVSALAPSPRYPIPTYLCSPQPFFQEDTFSRPAVSSADPEKESAHICRERKKYGEVSFYDFGICLVLLNIEEECPQNSRVEFEPIRSPFHPT